MHSRRKPRRRVSLVCSSQRLLPPEERRSTLDTRWQRLQSVYTVSHWTISLTLAHLSLYPISLNPVSLYRSPSPSLSPLSPLSHASLSHPPSLSISLFSFLSLFLSMPPIFSLTLSLSPSLSMHLVSLSICLSFFISPLSDSFSMSLFVSLYLYLSQPLSLSLSMPLYLSLSRPLSLSPCISFSLSRLSNYLSI